MVHDLSKVNFASLLVVRKLKFGFETDFAFSKEGEIKSWLTGSRENHNKGSIV